MTQNLIIRGFDDKVHTRLGELAQERGVSINSIVKDAVDKWLKQQQQSQIPRKHHLVIYSNNQSMMGLLKSMDRLVKEGDLFRCFCGPPDSSYSEVLSKLKWYDGTVEPYCYPPSSTSSSTTNYQDRRHQQQQQQVQSQKDIMKYCGNVMENIAKNANNKQVCCMDFLINDIAKTSLKQALTIEEAYNNNRIAGLMYCTYKTETLLNSEIKDMIELFEMHDQIFILKDDEVYKLHVTKENVHKLFLS
jgi:hypothetical protein